MVLKAAVRRTLREEQKEDEGRAQGCEGQGAFSGSAKRSAGTDQVSFIPNAKQYEHVDSLFFYLC